MKFLWTTILVKDLDESVAFYSDVLELKVLRRFPAGGGKEIAFLGNAPDDATTVELIHDPAAGNISHSRYVSIGFAVPSVDEMLSLMKKKNIAVHGEPVDTPKFKFFTIRDPNGLDVQLFQYK